MRQAVIGWLIVVFVAIGCRAPEVPSSQADWVTFRTPAGFSFRAPADLEPQSLQAIDSNSGVYANAALELVYDRGWHPDPLLEPIAPEFRSEEGVIDGRKARLVSWDGGAGAHFPEVDGGMRLTVTLRSKEPQISPKLATILHSIRFE